MTEKGETKTETLVFKKKRRGCRPHFFSISHVSIDHEASKQIVGGCVQMVEAKQKPWTGVIQKTCGHVTDERLWCKIEAEDLRAAAYPGHSCPSSPFDGCQEAIAAATAAYQINQFPLGP